MKSMQMPGAIITGLADREKKLSIGNGSGIVPHTGRAVSALPLGNGVVPR